MKTAVIDVIKMSWPTIVIAGVIIILMRVTMIIKSDHKKIVLHDELMNLLFVVYLIILYRLVTSQDLSIGGTNLTPFKEILRYKYGTSEFYKQVFGNVILFIPLGYFFGRYCKLKGLLSITLLSGISSFTIEFVQHFIGRSFDIDDIILNIVGGIVGWLIYIGVHAIQNHLPKFMRKDWFYTLISVIIIALGVLYVLKIM